jgi:hypothetical protein
MSIKPNQTEPSSLRATAASYQVEDADIDVSLVEDSLRLSPWQRLIENDRALGLVRMLEQAGKRTHGAFDGNLETPE